MNVKEPRLKLTLVTAAIMESISFLHLIDNSKEPMPRSLSMEMFSTIRVWTKCSAPIDQGLHNLMVKQGTVPQPMTNIPGIARATMAICRSMTSGKNKRETYQCASTNKTTLPTKGPATPMSCKPACNKTSHMAIFANTLDIVYLSNFIGFTNLVESASMWCCQAHGIKAQSYSLWLTAISTSTRPTTTRAGYKAPDAIPMLIVQDHKTIPITKCTRECSPEPVSQGEYKLLPTGEMHYQPPPTWEVHSKLLPTWTGKCKPPSTLEVQHELLPTWGSTKQFCHATHRG